ncbi:LAME_0H14136g1_1 [Lachancea meyersii CBS 8951]|uniref:LAME_0H14136g1_1 n=1 Tax=Lachancea meyersii CBS 8951 TaxID=1266667 RepID=A0A1G4KHG5_9SACH|nr:LAME_0H14136g1_1 [Lachancea meyersii CBS 8951]
MVVKCLFNTDGWLIIEEQGVLRVYFDRKLRVAAIVESVDEFQCYKLAGDSNEGPSIFGIKAGKVVRMWYDKYLGRLQEECVLSVSFQISKFQILPAVGWILATDSVAGILHIFDTIDGRYRGRIKIDPDCDEICVSGPKEFRVLARKFDQNSLLIKTFLNTYTIGDKYHTFLVASVPVDHQFDNRWICKGVSQQDPFALVNCKATSLLEFFLPTAQTAFQKLALTELVLPGQSWFSAAFNMILVLQAPQGFSFRMCELDIVTNREIRSVPLIEESVRGRYKIDHHCHNSIEKLSTVTDTFSPSELRFLGRFSYSVAIFEVLRSPNLLLAWQEGYLWEWWFPSAVFAIARAATGSAIVVECGARASRDATEIFQIKIAPRGSLPECSVVSN